MEIVFFDAAIQYYIGENGQILSFLRTFFNPLERAGIRANPEKEKIFKKCFALSFPRRRESI